MFKVWLTLTLSVIGLVAGTDDLFLNAQNNARLRLQTQNDNWIWNILLHLLYLLFLLHSTI